MLGGNLLANTTKSCVIALVNALVFYVVGGSGSQGGALCVVSLYVLCGWVHFCIGFVGALVFCVI